MMFGLVMAGYRLNKTTEFYFIKADNFSVVVKHGKTLCLKRVPLLPEHLF